MEKLQNTLSEEEKQALLTSIWNDKRGRINSNAQLALYVTLDCPMPDFARIKEAMLAELLKSPSTGFNWAEDWGRVVVCVGPGGSLGTTLSSTKEERIKRFVPVHTNRKLVKEQMQDLLSSLSRGELGTILINSESTTIEAFLISYVHMLDEAIWELYRSGISYRKAVEMAQEKGFQVKLATEEEILLAKVGDDRIPVRLYGSNVNRDVQCIMGAFLLREDVRNA